MKLKKEKTIDESIKLAEKKYKRRKVTFSIIKSIFVFIILIGSLKGLISVDKNNRISLEEQSLVESYISTYYKYPKDDDDISYLNNFSHNIVLPKFNEDIESNITINSNIYNVKEYDDYNDYYIKVNNQANNTIAYDSYIKLSIKKYNDSYIITSTDNIKQVLEPVNKENIDVEKLQVGNQELNDTEKTNTEDLIILFLNSYSENYEQAMLLATSNNSIERLDTDIKINLENINRTTKDEDYIYAETELIYNAKTYQLKKRYLFIIDHDNNKITKMEEIKS